MKIGPEPPDAPYCPDYCPYYDVWVMDADGTDKTLLTPGDASNGSSPTWSPDGTKIAFAGSVCSGICVTDADGSNQTPLSWYAANYDYDFSPNGAKVAFTRYNDIWIMNADGSNEARLTDGGVYSNPHSPAFSPDGKKIAFAREGELWVMDVDGSNERLLGADVWGDLDWQPNTAPVVIPCGPSPGSATTDRTPRMAAKARDLQTDLAKPEVQLFVDGRRVRGFSYDGSREVLSYTPGESLPFGRHAVRVVARDDAGLAGREEWSFRVARP